MFFKLIGMLTLFIVGAVIVTYYFKNKKTSPSPTHLKNASPSSSMSNSPTPSVVGGAAPTSSHAPTTSS